jgi:hypothetical protein
MSRGRRIDERRRQSILLEKQENRRGRRREEEDSKRKARDGERESDRRLICPNGDLELTKIDEKIRKMEEK